MWHTALFTLLSTPPLVLLALVLALLVSRAARLQWFFRLAFFLPYMLPVSVVALIWNWLYQPGFGRSTPTWPAIGFAEVNWLGNPTWRCPRWRSPPCGGRSASTSCSTWPGSRRSRASSTRRRRSTAPTPGQQIRRITLPLLARRRPGRDAPGDRVAEGLRPDLPDHSAPGRTSTRPAIQHIYDAGFTQFRIGYAARCRSSSSSSSWPSPRSRCGWSRRAGTGTSDLADRERRTTSQPVVETSAAAAVHAAAVGVLIAFALLWLVPLLGRSTPR